MDTKKFLQQVHKKLMQSGITETKIKDDCIEIYDEDNVIFKIDGKGGMFYSADKQFRDIVDKLHDKIHPIVCEVEEYLKAMENSTELKANDFNMPYRKLAEFNGVVFAGTEHSTGDYEFATWDYSKNSLYQGHYYTDYKSAKADFATRSKLLNENLIFNKNELVEIYRCIEDTLGNGYELSDEQTNMLEKIQNRIKISVDNFDEALREATEKSEENNFEQSI